MVFGTGPEGSETVDLMSEGGEHLVKSVPTMVSVGTGTA